MTNTSSFWPDLTPVQSLLLPHSSTLLYPSLPRFQNSYLSLPLPSFTPRSTTAILSQPPSKITHLQQTQNSFAHAVVKAPKSHPMLFALADIYINSSMFSLLIHHSLFISGHTCLSTKIVFSANNKSTLSVCFNLSLESTPGFSPATSHQSSNFLPIPMTSNSSINSPSRYP